jgi:hypothetical protein
MPLKHLLYVKAFFIQLVINFEKTPIKKNTSVDIKNEIRSHELSLEKLRINFPKTSSDGWDNNNRFLETQHLKASEKLRDLSEQEDLVAIRKLLKQNLSHSAIEENKQGGKGQGAGEMSFSRIPWSEAKQGLQSPTTFALQDSGEVKSPSEYPPLSLPLVEIVNDSIDSIMAIKPIIQPMPIESNPYPHKNN